MHRKYVGTLDKLPAQLRHLVILVTPVLLGWVTSDFLPWFSGRSPALAGLAAAIVTGLGLWLTPLTKQYGVGAEPGV